MKSIENRIESVISGVRALLPTGWDACESFYIDMMSLRGTDEFIDVSPKYVDGFKNMKHLERRSKFSAKAAEITRKLVDGGFNAKRDGYTIRVEV